MSLPKKSKMLKWVLVSVGLGQLGIITILTLCLLGAATTKLSVHFWMYICAPSIIIFTWLYLKCIKKVEDKILEHHEKFK